MGNSDLAASLTAENAALKTKYSALESENAMLKADNADLRARLSWLEEQLLSDRRKLYGVSSEKGTYANGGIQMGLFDSDAQEIIIFDATDEPDAGTEPPPKKRPRKRGEMGARLPDSLPVETIEHELPAEECFCPECANPMHPIGKEVARRELKSNR
jgi:hypothetical protein